MEEDESTFAAEESEHASLSDLIEQHFYSAIELRSAGYDLDSLKDRFDVYDLKHAGYTASELRVVGKPLNELKGEFNVDELQEAGFSALDLKSVGFSIDKLRDSYDVLELSDAGYALAIDEHISELKRRYSVLELTNRGYSPVQLASLGYNLTLLNKYCNNTDGEGMTALEMWTIENTLSRMKEYYTVAELRRVGYGLQHQKTLGFTMYELKDGGFTVKDMLEGGYSLYELKGLGPTTGELLSIGYDAERLVALGYSTIELKKSGTATTTTMCSYVLRMHRVDHRMRD